MRCSGEILEDSVSAIQVKYAFISLGALCKTLEEHKQELQLPREPFNQENSRSNHQTRKLQENQENSMHAINGIMPKCIDVLKRPCFCTPSHRAFVHRSESSSPGQVVVCQADSASKNAGIVQSQDHSMSYRCIVFFLL